MRARLVLLLLVVVSAMTTGALALTQSGSRAILILRPGHLFAPRSESFISLIPACGCGKQTDLDQLSVRNGRVLGVIAEIPSPTNVSVPRAGPNGSVLLTFSNGPSCGEVSCIKDTCSSSVRRLDLHTGAVSTLYRPPDSMVVSDAVTSPRGHMLAMSGGACRLEPAGFIVRDIASGHQWTIGANLPPCTGLGPVAWSSDSDQLLFAYAPVVNPKGLSANPPGCTATRPARLAIAAARRPSSSRAWKLIRAAQGCSYEAGVFDSDGIAAVEGCQQGGPSARGQNPLGQAYLVQLNPTDHVVARWALRLGWEKGLVTTEPDGKILVSQDQPANEGYPERDWIWEFDGNRLRPIAHYSADDAAQVIAVAW